MKKFTTTAICTLAVLGSMQIGSAFVMAAPQATVSNLGNTALEQELKQEIQKNMVNETDEDAHKQITTNYEQKYFDGKKLSAVITTVETQASSGITTFYYNYNVETGQPLTLAGLMGENYKEKINKSIHEQIKQRMAKDENQIFFGFSKEDKDLEIKGFDGISDNQTFYINEKGNVVITFEQFSIAPGYMGIPEFEITK